MDITLKDVIGYIVSFLAGATLSFVIMKVKISNRNQITQSHNQVKGDFVGRDKIGR
ncbi:hypothetical protein [Cohnella caldifontis]|uniref:hypothetical protein n=1 Tax=Cohnella caldifontis TaxID=3027471 RepID=UPI0023ED391A|nr:hypothetical protein [Cohnella sp. YIM B05605]